MVQLFKAFAALLADIGSLSGMHSHMYTQVSAINKFFIADRAGNLFLALRARNSCFSSVSSQMSLKMAGKGKAPVAVLADVWLSCGVGVQMRHQIQPVIEELIAVFAFINNGTFVGWLVAGHIGGGRGNR